MTVSSRFRSLPVFRHPEEGRWGFALLSAVSLVNLVAAVVDEVMWRIILDAMVTGLGVVTAWSLHREALTRR